MDEAFKPVRLFLVFALVAGCTTGDGAGTTPTASPTGAATADDEPLVLGFTPEADAAVKASVTLEEGGEVVAEAADGTTFELTVPPEAVAEDTEIILTPLAEVEGLGTDGPVHAVQLEPEGLELFAFARLTVRPPQPIPVEQQLAFEAAGDGTDARLALVDPSADEIVLLLEHFSGAGVSSATPQQQATFKAKSATNALHQLYNELRERIRNQDHNVSDLTDRFLRDVLAPLREAAALDCAGLATFIKTAIGWERHIQLIGLSEDERAASQNRQADAVTFAAPRYAECEQEAIERCRAAHDPGLLVAFWLEFDDVQQPPPGMKDRAEQICKPQGFALRLTGTLPLRDDTQLQIDGVVRGCPTDADAWAFRGEFEQVIDYGDPEYAGDISGPQPPETWYAFDMIGGQQPDSVTLVYTDWETPELHEKYMGDFNDNVLTITDATGTPSATLRLYDGYDELIGDFDLAVEESEPECPLEGG